jgi:hypothetical protein
MVERYVKTDEEHPRKVITTHLKDWDEKLPIFLLAYAASTHETTGMMPTSMVFGRELSLPYDLFIRAPPNKEPSTTDYVWTSWIGCMTSIITPVSI